MGKHYILLMVEGFWGPGFGVFFHANLGEKKKKYLRDILTVMVPHKIQS